MHNILDTIKNVINVSDSIAINENNIKKFCLNNNIETDVHWLKRSPQNIERLDFQEQLNFIILLDTISFCFWKLPKWKIKYKNQYLDGSWGMVAAIAKARDNGIPILDFNYLRELSLNNFFLIVEDKTKLAFKEERVKTINEVARAMIDQFDSNTFNLIKKANYDATELQKLIISMSTSFIDSASYNNETILFNKKAQLLASDLNYVLELNGKPSLQNIDKITACADYKIPYILRESGILEYNEHLSSIVDNRRIIDKGSREEVEIRSYTIWAIELLKNEYGKSSMYLKSKQINDYLWLLSQTKNEKYRPYHLTLTPSY